MSGSGGAPVELAIDIRCRLAESPVWDDRAGALYFVDIVAGAVHRHDAVTSDLRSYAIGQPVGAVGLRVAGGLIMGVRDGFSTLDPDSGAIAFVASIARDPQAARMNDGKVDPGGRFWAGTLSDDGVAGAAALYCLDASGAVTTAMTGVGVSNGLAWSPDATVMYYVDTATQGVDTLGFDPSTGRIAGRRRLIDVPEADGRPDGLTVDEEGYVWLALFGGGEIRRYSPEGELERTIGVPASNVTSCTFGGEDLRDLFITTATHRLLAPEPLAGAVFRCRPGPRGLPANRFGG